MELRHVRRPHQRRDSRRAPRLAVVPRRLSGRGVAGPGRSAGRPRDTPGAGDRGGRTALFERTLSPNVRRALAWARTGGRQVLRARHGPPQCDGLRARSVRAGDPALGRDASRTARQPGAGAGAPGESTTMSATKVAVLRAATASDTREALLRQYGG